MKTPRATLERFHLIEAIGQWEGAVSNARLRDLTGLHTVQVSRLIASYIESNPGRLQHDVSEKKYRWSWISRNVVSLDEYLSIIVSLQRQGRNVAGYVHDLRVDVTDVVPNIYAALNEACTGSKAVEIEYQSMTSPKGAVRIIEPHSIVHVGRRWHVRAWCRTRERFLDFNIGRIVSAKLLDSKAKHLADSDMHWSKNLKIRLVPHRYLSNDQASVVCNEFLGNERMREIESRACLVQYVIQELRASIDPEVQKPPDYQIEVANVDELSSVLFSGGTS
jgi:hypothetical protein